MLALIIACVLAGYFTSAILHNRIAALDWADAGFFTAFLILAISKEDILWNTTHPCKKFTAEAYRRGQFPAFRGISKFGVPIDYLVAPAISFAIFILSGNLWLLWIEFFLGMAIMVIIETILAQKWNSRTNRAKKFENYARRYLPFESTDETLWTIRLCRNRMRGIVYGEIMQAEGIPPETRYSEEFIESGQNPNSLKNMLPAEVTLEDIQKILKRIFSGELN